jgi:HEAT repeat protein
MRVKRTSFIFLLHFFFLYGILHSQEDTLPKQILYYVQAGNLKEAIHLYQEHYKLSRQPPMDLLQNIGLMLIDQGWRSRDPETQVMALFGAGISAHDSALYILESGLRNPLPQVQLIALNLLAKYQHDQADEALNIALGSNELLIRFEALTLLTEKKHAKAFGQIEALMSKVDKKIHFLFPPFFAKLGDPRSIATLKRLLSDSNEDVRISAIISSAKYGRDDLLPQIRILSTHHEIPQQEACAVAMGLLKDGSSLPYLNKLTKSSTPNIQAAALQALYRLGQRESKNQLEDLAKSHHLFVIYALGEIAGSEPCLRELVQSPQLNTRINAAVALLKDPLCFKMVQQILIYDTRDLCLQKISSVGKGLTAIKAIPSARQNLESDSTAYELSLGIREEVLELSFELPEKDFLCLAEMIFAYQQNELVPTLVNLLGNLQTPGAIALLKTYQQKAGAPLIRNYCNLALCKLKEPGPYQELLSQWVIKQQNIDLISFRPYISWESREMDSKFELTPRETSSLLIEAFETFAKLQDDKGIEVILEAIVNGNSKNKYALAGLLIRAAM